MEYDDVIDVAELAAVLTVAGVTIYVLGLTGIFISIRRRLLHNTSTAWYVTSLVPRTVVAGQGVRIWLGVPIFVTVVELLTVLVAATAGSPWLVQNTYLVFVNINVAVLAFVFLYASFRESRIAKEMRAGQLMGRAISLVSRFFPLPGIFLVSWAGALFAKGLGAEIEPFSVWIDPFQNIFLLGGVLLFVGSFFLGVPLATTIVVPLFPRVRIATKDEGVTLEGVPLEGQLVAHSNGFWHIFSDKDNEFLSIPDEQVLAVRIHEKGAEPTVNAVRGKLEVFLSLGISIAFVPLGFAMGG